MSAGFEIGDGYACYRGPVADSAAHRHAAFQVAIAVRGEVAMLDASGTCHRAAALVVPPMTWHRMLAAPDLRTYFVDPQCAFADRLRGCRGVTPADELRDLDEELLRPAAARTSGELDPRLVAAMDAVWDLAMPELAARVGLSPQRLRALARAQLGMPLTRWRVWARLRRAAEALRAGRSLAEAALTAGFADQAHLTRWMREMMGLTPAAVLPALRGQSRHAV
ncbi:helix-turn-helix domain-containing protein [Actinophytocola oryzae]|uniref:helix-turn-helix domain-containing protein n=1 Tax=Actinophytocola oryzae TaxID=502181 RepID=UPI0024444FF4|nr:helix-turn-helix domain-containing protein [Actinophytocola oryzae]